MLKIYNVYAYISIDGADWRKVNCYRYIITDKELETELILDNASFDEVRAYLSQHLLPGIYNEETWFRHKPLLSVSYSNAWDAVLYRRFNTLSYKAVYEEKKDVSMQWIMENASADQAIQYLKERGITTCPMNF